MEKTIYIAPKSLGLGDGSSPQNAMGSLLRATELAAKENAPVTLQLLPGMHLLSDTLHLTQAHNGLTFRGSDATICSGTALTGWQEEGNGIVSAPITEGLNFNRLYFNGQARERTRYPAEGHFETKQVVKRASLWLADMTPEQRAVGKRTLFFHPEDLPKDLYSPENIEFVVLQYWMHARGITAESIDYDKNEIILSEEAARPYCWSFGYYLENVREGLDQPGRWYHDKKENRIYYHLQPGESLKALTVTCPTLQTLIMGNGCRNVRFEGVSFCFTDAHNTGHIHNFPQAELPAPVAVILQDATACRFDNCHFNQLGGYGLWLRGNSRNCEVSHCRFTFCGAGAIRIGQSRRDNRIPDGAITASYAPHVAAEDSITGKTGDILITDCLVADCGWYYHGAAGIWLGQADHCSIMHNDISGPLMWAISVGWVWDIFPLNQTDSNRVEKNFIHELGTGILGTHGAIYMLGVSPNTTVRGNYIRNVYSTSYWGSGEGIILDNCCSGIAVQDNIVMGATAGGWGCNFDCFGNIITNNIFCFGEKFQLTRYGDPPKTAIAPPNGEIFSQNIVIWKDGPLFGEEDWLNFSTFWDRNLYWCTEQTPTFLGRSFEAWKELGMDVNSIIADPLLKDPEKEDFTIDPNSPAFTIGFTPIDISDVGIRK